MWYYFLLSLAQALLFLAIIAGKRTFEHGRYKVTLWFTLGVFLACWGINYFNLPTLAWWGFEGVWIETFAVSLFGGVTAYCLYLADPRRRRRARPGRR